MTETTKIEKTQKTETHVETRPLTNVAVTSTPATTTETKTETTTETEDDGA